MRGCIGLLVFVGLASITEASDQATPGVAAPPSSPSRARVVEVARSVMDAARYCGLVTRGPDGHAQVRIVDPLPPDADLTIDFATNPRSRKVDEIKKDPRVTLLYFDAARPAYVTVVGRAREITGPLKTGRHKPAWQAFFPAERPESYSLFRVFPERIEVVSVPDGLSGDPLTWRPDAVVIK